MNDPQKKIPLPKLIAELCPDGVEFKTLGEISDIISGYPFDSSKFSDSGIRLIRGMNVKRGEIAFSESINRYWNDDAGLERFRLEENDIIVAMDGLVGTSYGYIYKEHLPALLVQRVARIRTDRITARYIYHFLGNSTFAKHIDKRKTKGVISHITLNDIASFKIPVPPMEIQREIVRILDKFTELGALLETELVARKKQYEYYRNKLLTFGTDVPRVNICEIFEIRGGYTPSKANSDFWDNGTIPWFVMEDIRKNGRVLSDSIQHITPEAVKGNAPFPANSIIMATSATIGEHALITVDHLCNQRFINLKVRDAYSDLTDIKFLFYYAFVIDEWCKKNTSVSSFATVDMAGFRKLEIPLPPLSEQHRIAGILDRFDSLCNDLSSGIPAEIAARKKQYEYYRDRLLTFREKNS